LQRRRNDTALGICDDTLGVEISTGFGETVNLLLEQAQTMGSVVQTAHKVGCLVEYRLKQKEAYGLHPAQ